MIRNSLRIQLLALWLICLVVSGSLAAVMVTLYGHTAAVQIEQGKEHVRAACRSIAKAVASAPPAVRSAVLERALLPYAGVEGGIWRRDAGFIAYAFPTYVGASVKTDVPEAERQHIAHLARNVLGSGESRLQAQRGSREAVLTFACPLAPPAPAAAWTMTRIDTGADAAYRPLFIGLALLLAFVLLTGAWLGRMLYVWSREVQRLEHALASIPLEALPRLEPSGKRELDRIIAAFNRFSQRLREARGQSAELARQLAQADRLAAVGRMAANLAHEIRNPLGAIRLKAENALESGRPDRTGPALHAIVTQVERLDALLGNLLGMAQPIRLELREVELRPWLERQMEGLRERAAASGVDLALEAAPGAWRFDPAYVGRALDNLVLNGLQHTPPGGRVRVHAAIHGQRLTIRVCDDGKGIADSIRERIFEPFFTTRSDGTGLGLALVYETATAHGGSVRLLGHAPGACLEMSLPWPAS